MTGTLASPSLLWSWSCPVDLLQKETTEESEELFSHAPTFIPSFIAILCTRQSPSDRCDWWGGMVVTATLSQVSQNVMPPWPAGASVVQAQNRTGKQMFIVGYKSTPQVQMDERHWNSPYGAYSAHTFSSVIGTQGGTSRATNCTHWQVHILCAVCVYSRQTSSWSDLWPRGCLSCSQVMFLTLEWV